MKAYERNKRELNKEKALAHLGGKKCKRCGISYLPVCCYDFHHIKGDKKINVGNILSGKFSEIKKEIDKCVILCRNCHAIITNYPEFNQESGKDL